MHLERDSLPLHPPLGVWLATVGNVLILGRLSIPTIQVLLDPDPVYWAHNSIVWAPYVAALELVTFLSLLGACMRSRASRNLFLFCLTAVTALVLVEYWYVIRFWRAEALGHHPTNWWWLSSGPRWLCWLALNFWYFLGARTRAFFNSGGARSGAGQD